VSRLLVTGGSGYLGSHLVHAATAQQWEVCATYYSRPFSLPRGTARFLDLRDPDATRAVIRDMRPAAIIHAACSNQSADDVRAIVPAARHLALAATEFGCRLVHISTDLVFDGEHAPYADDSAPAPITAYGRAKAEAEALVAALCPAALIVRPSLIWGLDPLDRQTRWLVDGARGGGRVTLFTDELRCPVYVHDLCAALLELAARPDLGGAMNLGGRQALNRWELGMRLLAALGLHPGPNVVRGAVKESGLVRARDLTLISARAARLLQTRLRSVDEVLAAPAVNEATRRTRRPHYGEG
jgi:dTDP-4-dehydrorhamnose reductase